MKKQEIENWLLEVGYSKDTYGHYQKTGKDGKKYRMKFQKISLRYECQVHYEASTYSPASVGWIRLRSGYLSGLSLVDGKLSGLKR